MKDEHKHIIKKLVEEMQQESEEELNKNDTSYFDVLNNKDTASYGEESDNNNFSAGCVSTCKSILTQFEELENDNDKVYICISKDKLVLLSKLLKDLKNEFVDTVGKEKQVYKLRVQRRIVETLFDDLHINKFIDGLKQKLSNINLKKQLLEEDDEDF